MPIDPLPQPPSRSDPQNFAARGDAFMAALPTFAAQANALQLDVNLKEEAATTAAISASNDAQAAALAAGDAQSSKNAAANSASEAQTARDAALGYRNDAAESALAAANSAASVDLANLSTDYFGPDEPVTTWPGMTWAHTTNPEMTEGYLKRRNAANSAWVVEGKLFADASQASSIEYDNGASGLDASDIQAAIDEIVSGRGRFIGEAFAIWDHLSGAEIPDNSSSAKFIKLTAGDPYNAGLLTSESVTGSAPLVVATAQINLPESPIHGATVNLINTERRVLRAGESGLVQNDQVQSHRHSGGAKTSTVFAQIGDASQRATLVVANTGLVVEGRSGNETRMKNIGATYYMRIK